MKKKANIFPEKSPILRLENDAFSIKKKYIYSIKKTR
jgi:hypothetical protein